MGLSATERRLISEVGSAEEIYQSLTQFRKDVNLLAQQRADLTKKYPDKWVAFYDGGVISVANTLANLLRMVDKKGLPVDKVVTQFLSTQKRTMIL